MASNAKVKMRLQGHEKFALRDGWLNKGLFLINVNPLVFQGKEGPDLFGIGNNMVKSLRYWLKAFNLIKENSNSGASLTELGEIILEKDPYIEDVFTLWILHSQIAKNISEATSWYIFFNRCDIEEIDKEKVELILQREISKYASGQTFSDKSVKSDLDVILSMYGKSKEVEDPEDKNLSPFAQLKLIKNVEGLYSKNTPDTRLINEWNVLYELASMMEGKDNISIEQALNGECGISKIYQIKSVVANALLDRLDTMGFIRVDRTAGLDIIYKNLEFTPNSVMQDYYKKHR